MYYVNPEDEIADRYFDLVNVQVGPLALGSAIAFLEFSNPTPFAAIFFVVLLALVFSQNTEYKKISKSYIGRYKGFFGQLALMWRLKIYLFGYLALYLVAVGVVTQESVYRFWPF